MCNITDYLLELNGFEIDDSPVAKIHNKINPNYKSYIKSVGDHHITVNIGFSNKDPENGWTVHVDDLDFRSIAMVDISTIEQYNALLKLLNIDDCIVCV